LFSRCKGRKLHDVEPTVETLARTVKQLQWKHHRTLDTRMREIGSTLVQWDALRAISTTPQASAHELAQATFQSDQAFGTLANRMQARGLIEREVLRGRRIVHRLTPEGERILAAGSKLTAETAARSFAPLDAGQRAQLLEMLLAVYESPL
jgi:DNA-binding MarR family transcriptional regulator